MSDSKRTRQRGMVFLGLAVLALGACAASDIPRTAAADAHDRIAEGEAILVCAYSSEEKCRNSHLQDAISLNTFKAQAPTFPKDQELIFYCN